MFESYGYGQMKGKYYLPRTFLNLSTHAKPLVGVCFDVCFASTLPCPPPHLSGEKASVKQPPCLADSRWAG